MKRPAADAGASLTISERSGLPLALMPQCSPLARKPDGRGDAALNRPHVSHGAERCARPLRLNLRRGAFVERPSSDRDRGRSRTDRSCGTTGTSCNRGRSFRAPTCAARSRSRAARRTPDRARTRTGAAKPSRRARVASASTICSPRPMRRASRLTTSERTSATVCDNGASSAQPTMRSPAAEVATATTKRGACTVSSSSVRGSSLPSSRCATISACSAGASADTAARNAIVAAAFERRVRLRAGPLSTTTRIDIFTLSPLLPTPTPAHRQECRWPRRFLPP